MAGELTRTYTASDGQELTLSPGVVAKYIIGNIDKVPDEEYAKVIMTCAARGLNPLAGDVMVQPHWNKNRGCNELSMVLTKDYFQRRAAANPMYDGKESGIIVLSRDGRPVKRKGAGIYYELGEKLLAGWCEVFVKNRSKSEYKEATFSEFNTGRSSWSKMPAIMIEKVAKSQALREAFPDEFQGLYEPEEMGIETDAEGEPIQAQAVTIESADGSETTRIPVYDYDAAVEQEIEDPPEPSMGEEARADAGWESF